MLDAISGLIITDTLAYSKRSALHIGEELTKRRFADLPRALIDVMGNILRQVGEHRLRVARVKGGIIAPQQGESFILVHIRLSW